MKRLLAASPCLLALLLTGCPRNEYIVELKPQGDSIQRTLTFYRADIGESNKFNGYQPFATQEASNINSLYPAAGVTQDGDRHIARGIFTNALPDDVGGVGHYTNVTTSLGRAGFYVERFRGNDDIAGITEKHLDAANRLTDMVLGWSKSELGSQAGYEQLRQFLDVDLRRDLKNVGAYWWQGQLVDNYHTNAADEFVVRFGQYLVERGYLQIGEMPLLLRDATDSDGAKLSLLLRRFIARKMGVPDAQPLPGFLSFLENDNSIEASFQNYLTNTEPYRTRFKQWEEDHRKNPDLPKPDPAGEAFMDLTDLDISGGGKDHLIVRLSLPIAPLNHNGRWDEATRQVVWETDIDDRTNRAHLPAFCYANWAVPDENFQKTHFGKVALAGDSLTEYCIWRSSLDKTQAAEWDAMLTRFQPGEQLTNAIASFRFSGEPVQMETNHQTAGSSSFARELLIDAMK